MPTKVAIASNAAIVRYGSPPLQNAQGADFSHKPAENQGGRLLSILPDSPFIGRQPPIMTSWPSARASTLGQKSVGTCLVVDGYVFRAAIRAPMTSGAITVRIRTATNATATAAALAPASVCAACAARAA